MKMRLGAVSLVTAASLLGANAAASPTRTGATPSTAGSYTGNIAFVRDGHGDSLDVIHADGGEVARVTPPGTSVWEYAWSPNGRRIAYIDANGHSLWLAYPIGGTPKRLLAGSTLASWDLSWSPDGKEIAVTTSRGPSVESLGNCIGLKVYIVPIDGESPTMLGGTDASCDGIAWSPSGDEIAYGGGGIWVIHPNGSDRRRVSPRGGMWVSWSADGKQIAFGRTLHLPGFYRGIGVVHADGTHLHLVTKKADSEYPAVWSPKGHRLLYGRANSRGIFVIDADGRNDRRVTTNPPHGGEAPKLAWSPDGSSIVYAAFSGGLYEVGINGRGKVQLTSPANGDQDPSWVPTHWYWG